MILQALAFVALAGIAQISMVVKIADLMTTAGPHVRASRLSNVSP